MTNKKNKKGKRVQHKGDTGAVAIRHPLSELDPGVVREAITKMAEAKQSAFPDLLRALLNIFERRYPPHVLATLASYGLMAGVGSNGVADAPLATKIQQHHVELLQALALTLPIGKWGAELAAPDDIQTAVDAIGDLADAFHYRRMLAAKDELDNQQKVIITLQERLRLHTQMVRNWGYFSDVIAISEELYAPLDEALRSFHGFGATDLIRVARAQLSIVEVRVNQRFQLLKRIFREKKINRLVRTFFRQYPNVIGDPEEYIRAIPLYVTAEMVKAELLSQTDKQLVSVYLVSIEELTTTTGLGADVVRKVLASLALPPDALQDRDPESVFLDNPVWPSPIIAINDTYFCALPMEIFSFIHTIQARLVERANLKATLEKRRADFLEEKTAQFLGQALPGAKIIRNTKWRVGGAEYETDLVAMIDRTIVIAEAKSAALSAPALRGAPDRVRRHLRDLITKPSEQSARLEELIHQARAGDANAKAALVAFPVDLESAEQIVRLSVTLDDFSILSSSEGLLKEAGWIPKDLRLAPTLGIADFKCVAHILSRPGHFVHYLLERGRFQKAVEVMADEMDFLGFYLATGFNIAGFEESGTALSITGMSLPVDRYCNSRDAGVKLPKPVPKLTPYFRSLVERIQERGFAGWLGVTVDLLSVASYDEQKQLSTALEKLRSSVARNWRQPGHECSVAITPPAIRDLAVAFYVFPPQLADKSRETAKVLAEPLRYESKKTRVVLIARAVSRWEAEPYAFIYIARPSHPQPT